MPTRKPSSTSIAAMYWCTRSRITSHAPPITSTVVKVVRMISATEMPSTPSLYWEWIAGSHECSSGNCIALVPNSKFGSIHRLRPKAISDTASDSQRASRGRALPQASTGTAPSTGTQIMKLSNGQPVMRFPRRSACASVQSPIPEPAEQQDQSDDHREGVVIQKTGLHAAHDLRGARDERGRTVHHHAVQ